MSPSDGVENAGGQGEAYKMPVDKMPVAPKSGGPTKITQNNVPNTFPRFMDLPPKIRKQICFETLLIDDDRGKPFLTSDLATVSKEWRDNIDEVLFNDIIIDTIDYEDVLTFKQMFSTDRRRRLLTRLNIAIDDSETGPWHMEHGIFQISRTMTSIGSFLGYINGWDFGKAGGGRRPLEIVFTTSRFPDAPVDWSNSRRLITNTTSLWDEPCLRLACRDQLDLSFLPLRAVDSKFPSSLDMVTYLSISPDFMPEGVAKKMIQAMPNLETLVLDPRFVTVLESLDLSEHQPWDHMTDLIDLLLSSAPSLQNLTLRNTAYVPDRSPSETSMLRPHAVTYFSAALRDNSQGLRSLCASPFELDEEFFRPFSSIKLHVYSSTWAWPQLQHIDLQFFGYFDDPLEDSDDAWWDDWLLSGRRKDDQALQPDLRASLRRHEISSFIDGDPSEPILSPEHLLIAAGRATAAMPVLKSAHICTWSRPRAASPGIFAKRELCPASGSTMSSRVWLTDDFHPRARFHIMDAWAGFLGPDPKVDEGLRSEFSEITRASSPW
ncbi:hypothetical protein DHEL01_v206915 [Diaporthe helianthi]|uniref:Uncharacterized protein n=1 Tax=Diaporthe helianthi TaxID=158607 RepID=A0A2P5HWS9_DIAHE|nr:hypothetical protein DHEL01_v206915 [Diaporthe helianthi]